MRKLGIGVLGLLGGLIAAFVVIEVIVTTAVDQPSQLAESPPLAMLVGLTIPVLAPAGVAAALTIDRRLRRQHSSS
jgi:hypothetical protein